MALTEGQGERMPDDLHLVRLGSHVVLFRGKGAQFEVVSVLHGWIDLRAWTRE